MARLMFDVPYLRRKASGWYWEPSRRLKMLGYSSMPLGVDNSEAVRRAREMNARVDGEAGRAPYEPHLRKDTIAWLIKHCYLPTDAYVKLASKTKIGYDRAIRQIEAWAGDMHPRAVTRKAIKEWQRGLEQSTSRLSAAATLRVLRIVMGVAVDEGLIPMNPALRMRLATPGQRDRVWTDENVEAFCKAANDAGRRSIALALQLGLWLGQREADILKMGWDQVAEDLSSISVEQQKTGARIVVTITPDLRPWIEKTPRIGEKLVVSETTSLPYGEHNFRHLFAAIRSAAKLEPDLLFMDLRRSAATRLAQAGCTTSEIRAITGHRTLQILDRYVRVDETLARSAMNKLVANRSRTKN